MEQEKRTEVDPWEEKIEELIASIEASSDGKRRVTTDDIWQCLGVQVERRDRYAASKVSQCMQRLGFEPTKVYDKSSGKTVRGYVEQVAGGRARLVGPVDGEVGGDDAPF